MKKIFEFLLGFLVFSLIFIIIFSVFDTKNQEKIMDKRSLWYDADDTFVMLETDRGMIGVYQGSVPLEHEFAIVSSLITEGHIEDTVNWETLKKLIRVNLKTTIPDDTPCFIYSGKDDGYRYEK